MGLPVPPLYLFGKNITLLLVLTFGHPIFIYFLFQQAKAEQEEEFISNTLLKKIQVLKKEKESLAHHYEREEECLTNDLSRKLTQLRQEKCRLEQTLEQEQECLVNRLMRKIEKLEAETSAKQSNLEQLRREKVKYYILDLSSSCIWFKVML